MSSAQEAALAAVLMAMFVAGLIAGASINKTPGFDLDVVRVIHGEATTTAKETITVVTLPDGSTEYYLWADGKWARWEPFQGPQTQEAADGP